MEKQCEECGLMNTEGCNTCGVLNGGVHITVMQPTVVNVSNVSRDPDDADNVVPSENVSSLSEADKP